MSFLYKEEKNNARQRNKSPTSINVFSEKSYVLRQMNVIDFLISAVKPHIYL